MLPQHHRLRNSRDFTAVVRNGARATSGRVTAHVLAPAVGDRTHPPRMGLIVGKKVGNSVQRHRVSRVLRHGIADSLAELPAGTVVVIRALAGAAERDRRLAGDARNAVRRALERL